jgi:hypothetical protein
MGQLEMYSLDDTMFLAFLISPMSTYFSEEVEESIEDVIAYFYSANILNKKIIKLKTKLKHSGNLFSSKHTTFDLLNLSGNLFEQIYTPLHKRVGWQDPFLSQWENASKNRRIRKLKNRYNW